MAFQTTVQIPGDDTVYSISKNLKRYPLIDLGFEQTRQGNFKYTGSLDRTNPFKPAAKLQLIINGDLTGFKMATVSTDGLRKINIFTGPRSEEFVTQYYFILDEMVAREILVRG
jgi:hypothetical protein